MGMGVIGAIKKGFGIATKSLGLVLILFVFNLLGNIATMPFANIKPGEAVPPPLTVASILVSVLFILLGILIQGSSLALIRDLIKQGSMKLNLFVSYGLKYYVRLIGLGLLIGLIIGIIALIAALIVIATTPLNNTAVTVIAAIIAIIIGAVGLYYIFLLIMSPYAIVCEEMGIIEAMKKSAGTVRRAIGRVLLLLVLLVLVAFGMGLVIGLLTGLISTPLPLKVGQFLISIASSAVNSYLGVVMTASFMIFYLALVERETTAAKKVF